jgi:two-component system sensor histidine kinase DegS
MNPDVTSLFYLRDRFTPRAKSLFFARLGLDAVGLLVMIVPSFAWVAGVQQPVAGYWFSLLLLTHLVTYFWVGHKGDHLVVFGSLCFDLLALVYLITVTGGLRSPVMQGQIVYTVFFAMIFPSPLAILPPLLTLPVVTKIEQLLGTQMATRDLMLLLWYFVVNVIIVYVVVYLDRREEESFRELDHMQQRRRRYALTEERNRIAREMHDGLGAILSSMVIETEYVQTQLRELKAPGATGDGTPEGADDDPHDAILAEVGELRRTGQEGMEELRRAVSMMRDDFDLVVALEDQCASRVARTGVDIELVVNGREIPLVPDQQLACFRVLQESLSNAIRHAQPTAISVVLAFEEDAAILKVSDDGQGFDPATHKSGHYGLSTMRERAQSTRGDLTVTSKPGQGTNVTLTLPYRH